MTRIALFGGTFDPPHRGHLAIAHAAAKAFRLDQILFAPVGRQPLKLDAHPTSFGDRVAMVAATCRDAAEMQPPSVYPLFAVSTLDAPRPDERPNYTVDTLIAIGRQYPGAELFNLVGADSFLDLPRWHRPDRLLELAEWIVVTRPGYPLSETPLHLTPAQANRVHVLTEVEEDVSATSLRERLRLGDACSDLLTPSVAAYIALHGLYRQE